MIRRAPALFSIGALLLSCATASLFAHDLISTKVTWTGDVARLFQARCSQCHAAGGQSTIRLTTYEEARPWARAIREQVLTRRMPVWHAARGYGDFSNDPSLSPFEIALIVAWVDGGAPRGTDAGKAPPKDDGLATPAHPEGRRVTLRCANQLLSGRLLAVQARLARGGSVGIAAVLPDGRREVIAWIRDYDPDDPTTYWLRSPLTLTSGSRLAIDGPADCVVTATLAR